MKRMVAKGYAPNRWASPLIGFVFLCLLPGFVHGSEYVIGQVISAILLQERINLTLSDKAIVNIGVRDGLIKGDILSVTTSPDAKFATPIAECAVIAFPDQESSVCQIVKARVEVQKGNFVSIKGLRNRGGRFYPAIYGILSKAVDPYEPYKKVTVYVHDIFDAHNNVTRLSLRMRKSIEDLFSQKKRIVLKTVLDVKDFQFYPDSYGENYIALGQAMGKSGVDVFITGSYTVDNGIVSLTLRKFDKRFGDDAVTLQRAFSSPSELADATEAVIPFRPIEKKQYVPARITIKTRQYLPRKDEINGIISYESENDAFKVNALKRVAFDIVSPVNITVKVDDETLNFRGKDEIAIPALQKGKHKVTASFHRGYFANNRNSLLFSSSRELEKEMMLEIDKDGEVFVEVQMNASFDKEFIGFRVYRKNEKTQLVLRPLQRVESGKSVECFKD